MKKLILLVISILSFTHIYAQCKVISELNASGTMNKVTKPEVIYFNEKATMLSSARFDGVDFYFDWIIKPFSKEKVKSESMYIKLDNDSIIVLEFYDSYSVAKDTSINLLYRISKKNMEYLKQNNISDIKMTVDGDQKNYILILHKDLLRNQLQCILDSEKKEDKKEIKKEEKKEELKEEKKEEQKEEKKDEKKEAPKEEQKGNE